MHVKQNITSYNCVYILDNKISSPLSLLQFVCFDCLSCLVLCAIIYILANKIKYVYLYIFIWYFFNRVALSIGEILLYLGAMHNVNNTEDLHVYICYMVK